jgi:hypothetical protein
MIKFSTDTVLYSESSPAFRSPDTLGYQFQNLGNSFVYINNKFLAPGDTYITFRQGMEDLTLYRVEFRNNPTYPSPNNFLCEVTIFNKR